MLCTWDTGEVDSIEAHEYVRKGIHKDVFVAHEKVVVSGVPERFFRADVEAVHLYYRGSPESAAPFRQSPAPHMPCPAWMQFIVLI